MKRIIAALIAGGGLGASAMAMAMLTPSGVTRTDLQRHDLSIRGHEAVQARIDIAPGAVAPWHRHPGEEVIYVLEGTLEYQLEGRKPVTLEAGDVLFVPADVAHTARNRTDSNGAELATYVVEKGKPLLEPVEAPAPKVVR